MDQLQSRKFESGKIIFRQGEYQPFMYVLISGKVELYADYGKSSERLLAVLDPENEKNPYFGEMGLIEEMPRTATAVALTEVEVQMITREQLGEYFIVKPELVVKLMEQMAKRIRHMNEVYMSACKAVAESVEADNSGNEKGSDLQKKLHHFAEIYHGASEAQLMASLEMNPYINVTNK